MKTYEIQYVISASVEVDIEANSEKEAEDIATKLWDEKGCDLTNAEIHEWYTQSLEFMK